MILNFAQVLPCPGKAAPHHICDVKRLVRIPVKGKYIFQRLGDPLPFRQKLDMGVGIGLASLSLFVLLPLIFGVPAWAVLSGKAPTPGIIPMRVVFYLFFVGPVEELIFHGYLFRRLEELTKGPWQQCLISALLFGLWHFPASHSLINVLYCGAIGFFFGTFYIRKKDCSLLSLGLAHGLHDLGIFVLSQFLL